MNLFEGCVEEYEVEMGCVEPEGGCEDLMYQGDEGSDGLVFQWRGAIAYETASQTELGTNLDRACLLIEDGMRRPTWEWSQAVGVQVMNRMLGPWMMTGRWGLLPVVWEC